LSPATRPGILAPRGDGLPTARAIAHNEVPPMNSRLFRHPSAHLPIAMSLVALSMVLVHVATVGTIRHPDEGTAARVFQLLLVAQVPFVAWSAARGFPREPRAAALILLAQLAAAAAAVLAVLWFERS